VFQQILQLEFTVSLIDQYL